METKHTKVVWENIFPKYKHLEDFCTITVSGLEDDSKYFHPRFTVSEGFYITSQGDCGNNYIYAITVHIKNDNNFEFIEITEDLLEPVIIGYKSNKDVVILALNSLIKMRKHTQNLNQYANDYIVNLLIGNSINEISDNYISEIKAATKLVNFIQNQKATE